MKTQFSPSNLTHHEEGDAEVEEVTGDDGEEDGAGDGERLQEQVRHEHPSQDLRAELGWKVIYFDLKCPCVQFNVVSQRIK